jgi:hypothetical protein
MLRESPNYFESLQVDYSKKSQEYSRSLVHISFCSELQTDDIRVTVPVITKKTQQIQDNRVIFRSYYRCLSHTSCFTESEMADLSEINKELNLNRKEKGKKTQCTLEGKCKHKLMIEIYAGNLDCFTVYATKEKHEKFKPESLECSLRLRAFARRKALRVDRQRSQFVKGTFLIMI